MLLQPPPQPQPPQGLAPLPPPQQQTRMMIRMMIHRQPLPPQPLLLQHPIMSTSRIYERLREAFSAALISILCAGLHRVRRVGKNLSDEICKSRQHGGNFGTVSILMCIIAFGFDSIFSLLKQSAIVFGCGALLGGVMTAVLSLGGSYEADNYQKSGGITGLLACASVVFVYITVRLICNTKNRKYARVLIKWKGRDISFFALCDSGNLMRDPFSGDPVILL